MRDFTPEEKELIVNTPIKKHCFEKWNDYNYEQVEVKHFPYEKNKKCTIIMYPSTLFESLIRDCEALRMKYIETKDEHYFDILIHILPNSYNVVKL